MNTEQLQSRHLEAIDNNIPAYKLVGIESAATACALITIEEMKGFAEWLGDNGFIPAFNKSGINEIISNYLNQKK